MEFYLGSIKIEAPFISTTVYVAFDKSGDYWVNDSPIVEPWVSKTLVFYGTGTRMDLQGTIG